MQCTGFSIADAAILFQRTGFTCVAVHMQCSSNSDGAIFAMDDVFSFSGGTIRCYSLYKRICTCRKNIARGTLLAKFSHPIWIKFLTVSGSNLFVKVVNSWLDNDDQTSCGSYTSVGKGIQCPDGSAHMRRKLKLLMSKWSFSENWNWTKERFIQTDVGRNPIDCLNIWHVAIRKDLEEILEELYQIRSSGCFSNLDSMVIRLKFFADVLSFYG